MSSPKPIAVIGGGLAGLTLGIGLRKRGVPVSVIEAGHYPRHRVCGEFISGRGQDVLERLGIRDLLSQAGAIQAHTARFVLGSTSSPVRRLPAPALCLSRFVLDALLAHTFESLGGRLCLDQRWRGDDLEEGTVHANGRRLTGEEGGWRWFGLKAHARDVPLAADLEMHGTRSGYLGISRLPNGEINICGLFRRQTGQKSPGSAGILPACSGREPAPHTAGATAAWLHFLPAITSTSLQHRLEEASFDPSSFCSVGGLSLKPRHARASSECCIGDALTMIPPVTGNGMSMAFECAEIAIEPLSAYSRGQMSWAVARQAIANHCDAAFSGRLAWAKWLQRLMFWLPDWPRLAHAVLSSKLVWRCMFDRTR